MQWWMMPNDLPPWHTVYRQTQRRVKAEVFEALVHDLRMLLRDQWYRPPDSLKSLRGALSALVGMRGSLLFAGRAVGSIVRLHFLMWM
jgi:transposase